MDLYLLILANVVFCNSESDCACRHDLFSRLVSGTLGAGNRRGEGPRPPCFSIWTDLVAGRVAELV